MKKIREMMGQFSFTQMTSNENGKTSGSGTMGVLICTVGTLCFFMGCLDAMFITGKTDILTQTVVFVGMGVALLGVRKVSGPGPSELNLNEVDQTTTIVQNQTPVDLTNQINPNQIPGMPK